MAIQATRQPIMSLVLTRVRDSIDTLRRWRARRRTEAMLNCLTDAQLRDVGLHRYQLHIPGEHECKMRLRLGDIPEQRSGCGRAAASCGVNRR